MFHGSLVALVTPMKESGEVDFAAMRRLVDWQIENGTDALVVAGTTGESATLEEEEKLELIGLVVEQAAGRVPVIAGTGSNSTKKAIEQTEAAMKKRVDACLIVTPYYNKPTQEGLYQHYRAIAQAVPIPQILYNIPGRTACDLLPETVARLSSTPNIVAIKEGRPEVARKIIQLCGKELTVLSGDDATALEIIAAGGKGVVSVAANVLPKALHDMCKAALAGKNAEAQAINQRLLPLYEQLFVETNPIPVKWLMQDRELIASGIRLPLTPLARSYHDGVRAALQQAE